MTARFRTFLSTDLKTFGVTTALFWLIEAFYFGPKRNSTRSRNLLVDKNNDDVNRIEPKNDFKYKPVPLFYDSSMNDNDNEYKEQLGTMIDIAHKCGEMMLSFVGCGIETKTNRIDFVTECDIEIQRFIFSELRKKYPEYGYIGEEEDESSPKLEPVKVHEGFIFIVDPIDGTTNFVHKFPFSCVSIALTMNDEPKVGVVFNPYTDEMFIAVKGCGSFRNTDRIKVTNKTKLSESMLAYEVGYDRDEGKLSTIFTTIQRVLSVGQPHGVRMMGSAVLDLCYLACGQIDCLYSGVAGEGWKVWDHAAGSLLVTEAGGVIASCRKEEPWTIYSDNIVAAASKELLEQLQELVKPPTDFFRRVSYRFNF